MATTKQPEKISSILARTEPSLNLEWLMAQANEARGDYETAAREYRNNAHEEARLEAERPTVLEIVKTRLMGNNPALAATNADKMARCDEEYLDHLKVQRDTVRTKDDARTRMESARLRCLLAIAAIKAQAGLL